MRGGGGKTNRKKECRNDRKKDHKTVLINQDKKGQHFERKKERHKQGTKHRRKDFNSAQRERQKQT